MNILLKDVSDGAATNALRADYVERVTEVDGYVWCQQRGAVHDTTTLLHGSVKRYGGTQFYDLFEDGELCCDADHFPLYTTGEID